MHVGLERLGLQVESCLAGMCCHAVSPCRCCASLLPCPPPLPLQQLEVGLPDVMMQGVEQYSQVRPWSALEQSVGAVCASLSGQACNGCNLAWMCTARAGQL